MTRLRWLSESRWVPLAIAVAHVTVAFVLYYLLSHAGHAASVLSGVIGIVLIKHLAMPVLLGALYLVFRRHRRRGPAEVGAEAGSAHPGVPG